MPESILLIAKIEEVFFARPLSLRSLSCWAFIFIDVHGDCRDGFKLPSHLSG